MKEPIVALNQLLMLAHDALHAYTTALDRIRDERLRERLEAFRLDHERHLSDLTAAVLRLGGSPKSRRDLRGPLLQGMAAFSSMLGDGAALRAMLRAEELAMRSYAAALELELDGSVEGVIREGLQDVARHIAWLRPTITDRESHLHQHP